MVLGDQHGSAHTFIKALTEAKHHPFRNIVQVGDFGLWDHLRKGVEYLDEINDALALYGRVCYALGGNHENWDHWNWYVENMPKDVDGFSIIRSHVRLAPRIHRWRWEGKSFQIVAGAASIDKDIRLMDEEAGGSRCWWPQEQITDAEIDSIPARETDYLFTHDCSNSTPWGFQLIPDFDSQIHRQRIDTVLRRLRPKAHFHGHMHHKYEWVNMLPPEGEGDYHPVHTYGLAHNDFRDTWGILNVETGDFRYQPMK
jgi:hypothetical protein